MNYAVTIEGMRLLEQNAIQAVGIPEAVLMERAALGIWQELSKRTSPGDSVLFVCGTGNNGGDGLAAARMALLGGRRVSAAIVSGDEVKVYELRYPRRYGEPCRKGEDPRPAHCSQGFSSQLGILYALCEFIGKEWNLSEYNILVDAMFGIGLNRPVAGTYRDVIQKIGHAREEHALFVLSADIPSGVNGDTGLVMQEAVQADLTVTFGLEKTGLLFYPGAKYAGKIITYDIGIPADETLLKDRRVCCHEKEDLCGLPAREADTHKGDYGKIALIAGSNGMCGAAILAAKAAFRTGCGIVTVVSAEENRIPVQTALPDAIFCPRERADEAVRRADCIAVGPGIGTDGEAERLVRMALTSGKPVVADADALNCISKSRAKSGGDQLFSLLHSDVIITPHVGEMSRLTGQAAEEIRRNPLQAASRFARDYGCICVLKGARTVISDGGCYRCVNRSGNPGMAVAGSGDVLTGVISGLLAAHMEGRQAASLGVFVHGLAGDAAKKALGERSMMASDLYDAIPRVFCEASAN